MAGSVPNPKCGIEVTHKASPLQGEEIQVQGVQLMDRKENYVEKASHNHPKPSLKRGNEVTHKASPLQGEGIQVQGVQLMERQENYVAKGTHNHPQPLLILTSQIPQIVSNYVNQSTTIQESHPQKSISLFVFLFGFPLIDAL